MARVENETTPQLLNSRHSKEGPAGLHSQSLTKSREMSGEYNFTYSTSWISTNESWIEFQGRVFKTNVRATIGRGWR